MIDSPLDRNYNKSGDNMVVLLYIAFMFGYIYEDSDSLIVYDDTLTICGLHIYNQKVRIADTARLRVRPWTGSDSTGWLTLNAPDIRIEGSSVITGDAAGFWGGINTHPDGYGPGGGAGGNPGGGAGGGAGHGGAGGNGGGSSGSAGIAYGNSSDTIIQMGSGGGAGRLGGVEGFGGNGGGSICLRAGMLVVDSSSLTVCGETGDTAAMVAGGGGSGGGIMVWADTIVINCAALEASGGPGGPVDPEYGFGGGGAGGGRLKVFYSTFIDTSGLSVLAQGGDGGIGGYDNGQPGSPGTVCVDQLVGVLEIATGVKPTFSVKPNPARDIVVINVEAGPVQCKIYDAAGREVMDLRVSKAAARVNFGALPRGVYFLLVEQEGARPHKIVLIE